VRTLLSKCGSGTRGAPARNISIAVLFAAAVVIFGPIAEARLQKTAASLSSCTKTWTSPVSGAWSDGAMWSPGGAPTASDDVCISPDGSYSVTVQGSTAATSLSVGGTSGSEELRVEGDCAGSAQLTVYGLVAVKESGTITLASGGGGCSNQASELDANPLMNNGKIRTDPAGEGQRVLSGDLTNNGSLVLDHPLSFCGDLTNTGVVAANKSLTWQGTGAHWLNQGTLFIGETATVTSSGTGQRFTNDTGGSISIVQSGLFRLVDGTFDHAGGVISAQGDRFILDGSNLNLTSAQAGHFLWRRQGVLTGGLVPGQVIFLQAACEDARARVSGNYANAGQITLMGGGEGCVGHAAEFDLDGATLINTSKVRATADGGGPRVINGNLQNRNNVELALPGYALQVTGNYVQTKSAHVEAQITTAEDGFGQLVANGSATLAGAITIAKPSPRTFNAVVGARFPLLTASSRTGTWRKMNGGIIEGATYFLPSYSPTRVSLVVTMADMAVSPSSGPPGAQVMLTGTSFPPNDTLALSFKDAAHSKSGLGSVVTDSTGSFAATINLPPGAASGRGTITAKSKFAKVLRVTRTFLVT
jgi:hypothetical protein